MVEKAKRKTDIVLDKRILERMIQRGAITRDEVEAHLTGLPDVAEQADNIAPTVYGGLDEAKNLPN